MIEIYENLQLVRLVRLRPLPPLIPASQANQDIIIDNQKILLLFSLIIQRDQESFSSYP
jgi:hypothetical protein